MSDKPTARPPFSKARRYSTANPPKTPQAIIDRKLHQQRVKVAKGLCRACGKPRDSDRSLVLCFACAEKARLRTARYKASHKPPTQANLCPNPESPST